MHISLIRQAVIICMMECGNELLKFSFRQFGLFPKSIRYHLKLEKKNKKLALLKQRNENVVVFGVKAIIRNCVNAGKYTEQNWPAERMRLIVFFFSFCFCFYFIELKKTKCKLIFSFVASDDSLTYTCHHIINLAAKKTTK